MRGRSQCRPITAGGVDQTGALLPEVDLLLRRSNHQRDVTVLLPLLPHLEGRGFQNVTIHHRHRPHKAPRNREVAQLISSPGRVLLPGDGLGQTTVRGFSFWTVDDTHFVVSQQRRASRTCSTCWTDRRLRQVASLQPVFSRNTRLSASACSRLLLKTYEPLRSTAARKRPLAMGDVIRAHTDVPPSGRRTNHQSRGDVSQIFDQPVS